MTPPTTNRNGYVRNFRVFRSYKAFTRLLSNLIGGVMTPPYRMVGL